MCIYFSKTYENHFIAHRMSLIISKETFGLRGSLRSKSNHRSVKKIVTQNLEGIHGAMQQLMSRQTQINVTK